MNIPNLPSASLYRFKSIFGLILITLSLTCTAYLIIDYNQKSITINSESELLNLEIDNLNDEANEIIVAIVPICKQNNCKCFDERGNLVSPIFEKGPPLIHHKQKELKELYAKYENTSKIAEGKKARVAIKSGLVNNYLYFLKWFIFIVFFIIILGIVLLFSGFRDWRNKVQRYQDAILEAYSKKANSGVQYIIPRARKRLS